MQHNDKKPRAISIRQPKGGVPPEVLAASKVISQGRLILGFKDGRMLPPEYVPKGSGSGTSSRLRAYGSREIWTVEAGKRPKLQKT